jgi:hypothetical protein
MDAIPRLTLGESPWTLYVQAPQGDITDLPQVDAEQDVADLQILQQDRIGRDHDAGIIVVHVPPTVLDCEAAQNRAG